MRILVVGATGTIGREVVKALKGGNEIIEVSRSHTHITADISDPGSIRSMYGRVGRVDAVVCTAGGTRRKPLALLTDDDFEFTIRNKLMGQVNLVRFGIDSVADGGSFTLTSGILGRAPIPGSEAISLANLAVEGFARAAALELPRGIRINVVSPPWVTETLQELGMKGFSGLPAATVAKAYVDAVKGPSGTVIEPAPRPA